MCGINSAKIRKAIQAKIAQLQADLAALDRLDAEYGAGAVQRHIPAEKAREAGVEALPFEENKTSLSKIIREAIDSFGDRPFTKGDVLEVIKIKQPTAQVNPPSVASFLARLGKSGGLQIVQQGSGTMPSKYQKTSNPLPTTEEPVEL